MAAKKILVSLAFLLMLGFGEAQTLHIENTTSGDKIVFSVLRETNIFNYVIEGSDDSLNFEIIGAIKAKGYSMTPLNYDFTAYDKCYRNYLVKQIDISGSCVLQMRGAATKDDRPALPPGKPAEAKHTFVEW